MLSLRSSWQSGQGGGPGSLAGSRRRRRHFLELRLCLQTLSWAVSSLTPSSRAQLRLPIHRATSCPREHFPEQSLHGTPPWAARGCGKGHGAPFPPVLPLPGTPGTRVSPASGVQAPRGGAGVSSGGLPGAPCCTGGSVGQREMGTGAVPSQEHGDGVGVGCGRCGAAPGIQPGVSQSPPGNSQQELFLEAPLLQE